MSENSASATYAQRIAFVCEIASRLHSYGTTAQRLEAAVAALSQRLGLDCEPWSNPTGLILSFNDPARPLGASDTTRVIRLAESTRHANAEDFPDGEMPTHALTMGIATIMGSKQIVLLASGSGKAEAVRRLTAGELSEDFPASVLELHENTTLLVDREAAGGIL
jgi:hypothetical protein